MVMVPQDVTRFSVATAEAAEDIKHEERWEGPLRGQGRMRPLRWFVLAARAVHNDAI